MGLTQHVARRRQRRRCSSTCCCSRAISAARAPASARCAAIPTCRASAPSASAEKPELVPLDKLAELFGFEPPREKGMNTVEACEGMLDGRSRRSSASAAISSAPCPNATRWSRPGPRLRLTVQIATKLNRSHLIHGEVAYLLPCLGAHRAGHPGAAARRPSPMEDTFSCIHGSVGRRDAGERAAAVRSRRSSPASRRRRCRPIRRCRGTNGSATMPASATLIERDLSRTCSATSTRGCSRPAASTSGNAARERIWKTDSGKAEFTAPDDADGARLRRRARALPADHACASTISSTPRSTAIPTGCAASKAAATCC